MECVNFEEEFDSLQCKQKELLKELSNAYDTIDMLKNERNDRDIAITELEKQIMIAREAALSLYKAHNNNRIRYENEKLNIFKQHKLEVKSWRRDLGNMTSKHKNLERKLNTIVSKNMTLRRCTLMLSSLRVKIFKLKILIIQGMSYAAYMDWI